MLELHARVRPSQLEGTVAGVRSHHQLEQLQRRFARGRKTGGERKASALPRRERDRAAQGKPRIQYVSSGAGELVAEAQALRLLQRPAAAQKFGAGRVQLRGAEAFAVRSEHLYEPALGFVGRART